MSQPDMRGKICLVTGSSSGLGKSTAMGLAQLGATVILSITAPSTTHLDFDDLQGEKKI